MPEAITQAARRGTRSRLVPILVTLVVALTCLGLGAWQLERRQWKEALIAQREAALTAPAIAPPRSRDEARGLEFRRVAAEGVFLHDKEVLVSTSGPGGGLGFHVFAPLRQADGRILFVNRGYVPSELRDPASRPAGRVSGPVRVTGLLRLPPEQKPGWFLPDNRPDRQTWFWPDLAAMAAADGLGPPGTPATGEGAVVPFYVEADASPNPGGWPRGGATAAALPNNHLQYAITWFALAVAALVIGGLAQREAGSPRPGAGGPAPRG